MYFSIYSQFVCHPYLLILQEILCGFGIVSGVFEFDDYRAGFQGLAGMVLAHGDVDGRGITSWDKKVTSSFIAVVVV